MKKKFTDNDVLRFLYGEMSPSEHDAFLDAMYEDEELFEKFEELILVLNFVKAYSSNLFLSLINSLTEFMNNE